MLANTAPSQPSAAVLVGAHMRRSRRHRAGSSDFVVVAACTLFVCLSGCAAALTCDDTLGVSMTARHYNYDLEKMPKWNDKKCVDAEETKTVSEPSWPISDTADFVITIDGIEYDSNVAIVFEAYFDIPIPFTKFFQLNSTDGSKLFIDDELVIDHDGLHDFTGSMAPKWPLNGPKRFKLTVQYFKGAISAGTGLAVSWGNLRDDYADAIPASELKLNDCTAVVPSPPPDTRETSPTPSSNGRPVRRALPKACGGRCARGPQHRNKKPPPSGIERTLPPACHGKCNKKVPHKRKLPKACGGRCATMKPKTSGRRGSK